MADLILDWRLLGAYGQSLEGTNSLDTGGVNVGITFVPLDENAQAFTFNADGYVGPGEPFDPNSHLKLFGEGGTGAATTPTSATMITFSSSNEEYADDVQNISFRLADIDGGPGGDLGEGGEGSFGDRLTVNAYDSEGNPVPVTLSPGDQVTQIGNLLTGDALHTFTDPEASALVEIAGPVARIEILYGNEGDQQQGVLISDIHFATVDADDGDENRDPIANDDTADTLIVTPVTIDVLANDSDPDGDPLTVTAATALNGSVDINDDGTITYTPNAGFLGEDTITYTIDDGNGGTDEALVLITVEEDAGPERDGIVMGTPGDDLIDVNYTGDPDGDRIDNEDAILPGAAPNDDVVLGMGGNDTIHSGLGDDEVIGGEGDDSIDGGPGDDSLIGEEGNDTLIGGDGSDTARGGDGDDYIDTSGSSPLPDLGYPGLYPADSDPENDRDFAIGGAGNDTIFTGDDADTIEGGEGDDYLDGGIDADLISGGPGNDTIIGGEGADTIDGGDGDDLIYGGLPPSLPDELNIPDDVDLVPDNGTDLIHGGYGDDYIDGGIDNDLIHGDAGNDTIIGGHGADTMYGGDGRDVFVGANPGDVIDGGDGPVDDGPDDFDTLDLRGAAEAANPGGSLTVTYDPDDPQNGTVDFFDADGVNTGQAVFTEIENVITDPICFTPGTLIATPIGERLVEELKIGDRIVTRDNGIQEIRWMGSRTLTGHELARSPHFRPILIQAGSLGNNLPEHDMMVSPNHRMLVNSEKTALYFEEREVLVAAKHLVGLKGVEEVGTLGVTYVHFLFDQHEVVLANGAWSESFQPGEMSLNGIGNAQRNEIFELFPELNTREGLDSYQAARKSLKKHEAQLLIR